MISLETRLTGVFAEKDLNLRVTSCNHVFIELAGLKSIDQVLGLTDNDFCWNEYASLYVSHELDALQDQNYSAIIASKDYTGRQAVSLHTKMAKKDCHGNITGIICRAVEIINPHWSALTTLLAKHSPCDKHVHYLNKSNPFQLSKKECEVLFYLTYGKKPKVIATTLYRSIRTIEHHIEKIKDKLNCHSQSELISFAITHGFMQMLPHDTVFNLIQKLNTV